MELYLMRHGIAEDNEPGHPDSHRKLTGEGKDRVEAVLKVAYRGGMEPGLILSSPYLRAMETAKIAAEQFRHKLEIVRCDVLTPNSSPEALWGELGEHADEKSILLTSHEPLLGDAIRYLLNSPGLQIDVKKASIYRIDLPGLRGAPRGVLQWILTPKICLEERPR